MTNLPALWTALITPFHEDGSVDFESLEKLVKSQEKAGNGILLAGSTGEGLALTHEEKQKIVRKVCDMKLKVPVMAGVGGYNLNEQVEWIEECNQFGADAFLLVTPLYARPGIEGQTDWFLSLMDAAKKPCMIYNIPSRTGVKMPVQVLKNIEHHERFWSVKEASGSIHDYMDFKFACPDVPLFSGDDGLLPFFSAVGCSGLVSVASNAWPEETRLYVQKCLQRDTGELVEVWKNGSASLFSAPNPVPIKILMKEKGLIPQSVVRPPLSEKDLPGISGLMDADNKIKEWYQSSTGSE
ncbi:MAG: 4-hydroxy-tetrahydrodipicolinate synthase [Balneolaceae bacterium]|nr:4-hydroxy-tetrahydrodipicolinate synthase [Balneolaceae bacterium]